MILSLARKWGNKNNRVFLPTESLGTLGANLGFLTVQAAGRLPRLAGAEPVRFVTLLLYFAFEFK